MVEVCRWAIGGRATGVGCPLWRALLCQLGHLSEVPDQVMHDRVDLRGSHGGGLRKGVSGLTHENVACPGGLFGVNLEILLTASLNSKAQRRD